MRTELAEAGAQRSGSRRGLAVFHHLSDFRLLDEESPLRGEWQDSCPEPLSTAAFRPQESLTYHAAAALVRRANRLDRGRVTGRAVDFALHTGNGASNAQFNELRAFIDLMDGLIVRPESGGPGYEGVQTESPDARFPDLLARAQLPFMPQGVRYPWYAVLGNRDVLAQGNFPATDAARQVALGDEKIIDISPSQKEAVCDDPSLLLDPERTREILADEGTEVRTVTPDASRQLVGRSEWLEQLSQGNRNPGPIGHGFSEANLEDETAYYSFEHGPLAFVVLDTVNPAGFSSGSIDRRQFEWLERELKARSSAYFSAEGASVEGEGEDRLIVVVSHHPLDFLNNPLAGPSGEERVLGGRLRELLNRFPNVIAHLAGHSLANRITARPDPERHGGSYWEITTSGPVTFPAQGRLLEVADNGDGTISLFSTTYEMEAPIDPQEAEDPTALDDVNETQLAAIARSVAAQDPQREPEAAGRAPSDRNAELLLEAPFDLSSVETPQRHNPAPSPTPEARRVTRRRLLRLMGGA